MVLRLALLPHEVLVDILANSLMRFCVLGGQAASIGEFAMGLISVDRRVARWRRAVARAYQIATLKLPATWCSRFVTTPSSSGHIGCTLPAATDYGTLTLCWTSVLDCVAVTHANPHRTSHEPVIGPAGIASVFTHVQGASMAIAASKSGRTIFGAAGRNFFVLRRNVRTWSAQFFPYFPGDTISLLYAVHCMATSDTIGVFRVFNRVYAVALSTGTEILAGTHMMIDSCDVSFEDNHAKIVFVERYDDTYQKIKTKTVECELDKTGRVRCYGCRRHRWPFSFTRETPPLLVCRQKRVMLLSATSIMFHDSSTKVTKITDFSHYPFRKRCLAGTILSNGLLLVVRSKPGQLVELYRPNTLECVWSTNLRGALRTTFFTLVHETQHGIFMSDEVPLTCDFFMPWQRTDICSDILLLHVSVKKFLPGRLNVNMFTNLLQLLTNAAQTEGDEWTQARLLEMLQNLPQHTYSTIMKKFDASLLEKRPSDIFQLHEPYVGSNVKLEDHALVELAIAAFKTCNV